MARTSAATSRPAKTGKPEKTGTPSASERRARSAAEADPLEWSRRRWEELSFPDPERFIAAANVFRLREAVVSEFDRGLKPYDITRSMYLVLTTLSLAPKGGRRLSYLSRYLLVHATTVTLLVDQLEKRGLARREPDPTDRRANLATLTPAGRAIAREATAALAGAGYGLGGLTRRDLRQLVDAMRRVRTAIGDIDATS